MLLCCNSWRCVTESHSQCVEWLSGRNKNIWFVMLNSSTINSVSLSHQSYRHMSIHKTILRNLNGFYLVCLFTPAHIMIFFYLVFAPHTQTHNTSNSNVQKQIQENIVKKFLTVYDSRKFTEINLKFILFCKIMRLSGD